MFQRLSFLRKKTTTQKHDEEATSLIHSLAHGIYKTGQIFLLCIIGGTLFFFVSNIAIVLHTKSAIFLPSEIISSSDALLGPTQTFDAIVILGASVQGLQLSPILQDRVETAIQLYQAQKTKKLIVSGDNRDKNYREVDAMYEYLRNRGIPSLDIILDTGGVNTFKSIENVYTLYQREQRERVGVVSQSFHLPRAVFMGLSLGMKTYGISSNRTAYADEEKYELRESFARIKALVEVSFFYLLSLSYHVSH